ncbi:hypothetical protein MNBD_GAMMA16-224 [hydrothermal vent metagenome]|uniref:Uncharacterized protein n=1 Tax=hydrothermal vent metagenome TaxID=652676 RepID=A0A3B0ZM69_9ZZZZ
MLDSIFLYRLETALVKQKFPWIAAGIGGFFILILYFSGVTSSEGQFKIPLLMMLLMSEFGCIVTALGAYFGIKAWQTRRSAIFIVLTIACAAFSILLGYFGITLWEYITAQQLQSG